MGWVRFLAGAVALAVFPFMLMSIIQGDWLLVISYLVALVISVAALILMKPDDDFRKSTRGVKFIRRPEKHRGHE